MNRIVSRDNFIITKGCMWSVTKQRMRDRREEGDVTYHSGITYAWSASFPRREKHSPACTHSINSIFVSGWNGSVLRVTAITRTHSNAQVSTDAQCFSMADTSWKKSGRMTALVLLAYTKSGRFWNSL